MGGGCGGGMGLRCTESGQVVSALAASSLGRPGAEAQGYSGLAAVWLQEKV